MPYVRIPAGSATTTGVQDFIDFYPKSSGGTRFKEVFADSGGAPDVATPYTNGRVPITATSGAYGPLWVRTDELSVYLRDTQGTRTLVAKNYPPFTVAKTAIQTVTNSATLVADSELLFPAEANAVYAVEAVLLVVGLSTTADLKLQWGGPTSFTAATLPTALAHATAASTPSAVVAAAADTTAGTGNLTTLEVVSSLITTVATPGTVTLKWAQNTQTNEALTLGVGSHLKVRRII